MSPVSKQVFKITGAKSLYSFRNSGLRSDYLFRTESAVFATISWSAAEFSFWSTTLLAISVARVITCARTSVRAWSLFVSDGLFRCRHHLILFSLCLCHIIVMNLLACLVGLIEDSVGFFAGVSQLFAVLGLQGFCFHSGLFSGFQIVGNVFAAFVQHFH